MKTCFFFVALFVASGAAFTPVRGQEASGQSPDEAAIRANCDKYVEAYNRRDSQTMASMWLPDAIYSDPITGELIVGRDKIVEHFNHVFAGSEDAKLKATIDSIDFVSPNVAIEKGTAAVTYSDFEPEETTYTAVHLKRDDKWYIDRISEEEMQPEPPSHYENLKELEWLVGSWVDSDDLVTIQSEVEWTKNRNFLRRSFAVLTRDQIEMSGIQVIGWDPAAKQIRSWVFDSDGGFAEAAWTRKGDQWHIQNKGTLSDGGKATSLNIMTYIDDDSFRWASINRVVDGDVMPNVEEVLVVRVPDTDSTASAE